VRSLPGRHLAPRFEQQRIIVGQRRAQLRHLQRQGWLPLAGAALQRFGQTATGPARAGSVVPRASNGRDGDTCEPSKPYHGRVGVTKHGNTR
jgi:hypothetical protein